MCEFCVKHGEGKKWYEVSHNYSKELMAQADRESTVKKFLVTAPRDIAKITPILDRTQRRMPNIYRLIRMMGTWNRKKEHFGQVLPIEDAETVIDMAHCVTRIPCVCRAATRGRRDARYCLLLNFDPQSIFGDFPELRASLEVLTPQRAKELLKEFDENGLVHSVWTFKSPFIGGICNCDQDCIPYKYQVTTDLIQTMFKSEYLGEVSAARCVGCRSCLKLCQFGAVQYSVVNQKCTINPFKCYGCGVCRSACKKDAIVLIDRDKIQGTEGVW